MKKTIVIIIVLLIGLLSYWAFSIRNKKPSYSYRAFEGRKMGEVNQFNRIATQQSTIEIGQPVAEGLTLKITEPKENVTYSGLSIKVSGKTNANAEVYVNDIQTKADSFGNFSVNYNLDEGENLLTIVANDSAGNYAEKEITVFLQTQE